MTIEQQDKTPGAHAETPSPRPRDRFPELARRDREAHEQKQLELNARLGVTVELERTRFEVRIALEPDVVSKPHEGFTREQQVEFQKFNWWFKQARVEIWVSSSAEDVEFKVAEAVEPAIPEGQVTPEKHIGSWEGDYGWMRLLIKAANDANELLGLLESRAQLTVSTPEDSENSTRTSGSEPS
jgi:hypothetical protein